MPTEQAKQGQRIVCAANRNLRTGAIVAGARHFDGLMHAQITARGESRWPWKNIQHHLKGIGTNLLALLRIQRNDWVDSDQGFIDQWGTFLTRQEAHKIALQQGQVIHRCGGDKEKLFSESLY
jgi:hypothetical protein